MPVEITFIGFPEDGEDPGRKERGTNFSGTNSTTPLNPPITERTANMPFYPQNPLVDGTIAVPGVGSSLVPPSPTSDLTPHVPIDNQHPDEDASNKTWRSRISDWSRKRREEQEYLRTTAPVLKSDIDGALDQGLEVALPPGARGTFRFYLFSMENPDSFDEIVIPDVELKDRLPIRRTNHNTYGMAFPGLADEAQKRESLDDDGKADFDRRLGEAEFMMVQRLLQQRPDLAEQILGQGRNVSEIFSLRVSDIAFRMDRNELDMHRDTLHHPLVYQRFHPSGRPELEYTEYADDDDEPYTKPQSWGDDDWDTDYPDVYYSKPSDDDWDGRHQRAIDTGQRQVTRGQGSIGNRRRALE